MSELQVNPETAHPLARYRNHLEFYGYRVEEEEGVILCRHPRKYNLCLRAVPNRGVLVYTLYSVNPNVSRMDILEYVNHLNANLIFMKVYIDDDEDEGESTLNIETFYEGDYDRTNFAILLDNIDSDIRQISSHELTEKFLA